MPMAEKPKLNLNPRGRGRGRARARGWAQDNTVPSESLPQGHGRNIHYLATASTATEPRPGQRSQDVAVTDDVKITVADMATPEQGKVRQVHGKSIRHFGSSNLFTCLTDFPALILGK